MGRPPPTHTHTHHHHPHTHHHHHAAPPQKRGVVDEAFERYAAADAVHVKEQSFQTGLRNFLFRYNGMSFAFGCIVATFISAGSPTQRAAAAIAARDAAAQGKIAATLAGKPFLQAELREASMLFVNCFMASVDLIVGLFQCARRRQAWEGWNSRVQPVLLVPEPSPAL